MAAILFVYFREYNYENCAILMQGKSRINRNFTQQTRLVRSIFEFLFEKENTFYLVYHEIMHSSEKLVLSSRKGRHFQDVGHVGSMTIASRFNEISVFDVERRKRSMRKSRFSKAYNKAISKSKSLFQFCRFVFYPRPKTEFGLW